VYARTAEQDRRTQAQALAEQLYRERYDHLLRIAAKHAANREDAEEALQFSFSALIEKYDPAGGSPPLGWLTLTLQRRCWALYREAHLDRSAGQEATPDSAGRSFAAESIPSGDTGPEQLIELVEDARTRLAALKPAERRTLSLIAAGFSYQEVGQITGFSYTKTNRSLSEGRARLRELPREEAPRHSTRTAPYGRAVVWPQPRSDFACERCSCSCA
jgi:RNA polymerase sigma factor (sigma-70 family)